MGVLKAKVDGTWVEVGGAAAGVPAGGSAGQILTKTSAADYATAWQTPPIAIRATAWFETVTPAFYSETGFSGITRLGTGHVRLTFDAALSNVTVVVQAIGTSSCLTAAEPTATYVDVRAFTPAGTPTDFGLMIQVTGV